MKYFDSHAHYFDAWFNEYEGGAEFLLNEIFAKNVGTIVNVATNPENLKECIIQAQRYEKSQTKGTHKTAVPRFIFKRFAKKKAAMVAIKSDTKKETSYMSGENPAS